MRFQRLFTLLLLALLMAGCGGSGDSLQDFFEDTQALQTTGPAPVLTFRVLNTFPHRTDAFTQGLLFSNGVLYESTGLVGQSSLREVELTTGFAFKAGSL